MPETVHDLLIVGAGAFGLSSAMAALNRGVENIMILDMDDVSKGATADINKVIRCDYGSDALYSDLALKAIEKWKLWSKDSLQLLNIPLYHQTGVLLLNKSDDLEGFQRDSFDHLHKYGILQDLSKAPPSMTMLKNSFPGGYINTVGGWGNSSQALMYCKHVLKSKNVKFSLGVFKEFIKNGKVVKGVRCENGQEYFGNNTIIACGAWTPSLVNEFNGLLTATGQIVSHIQVPKSLISKYSWPNFQVWFADITRTGFYGFPVNSDGIMKIAIHGNGYLTPSGTLGISTPRSDVMFPSESIAKFKNFISSNFPDLADLDMKLRWCYYTDTLDGDFYICKSPSLDGLFYGTGGTGHAFKFMPVIGDVMMDVIQGIESDLTERFRWRGRASGVSSESSPIVKTTQTPVKKLEGMRQKESGFPIIMN